MLKSSVWLTFEKLYHERTIEANNKANGLMCSQSLNENDDKNHIDIFYKNGETEDCKYCGKEGIYINKKTLESNTTWISSIIGQYDYKVKRDKILEKYNNSFANINNELAIRIKQEDFIALASKKYKVNDDYYNYYISGRNIALKQYKGASAENLITELQEKSKNL